MQEEEEVSDLDEGEGEGGYGSEGGSGSDAGSSSWGVGGQTTTGSISFVDEPFLRRVERLVVLTSALSRRVAPLTFRPLLVSPQDVHRTLLPRPFPSTRRRHPCEDVGSQTISSWEQRGGGRRETEADGGDGRREGDVGGAGVYVGRLCMSGDECMSFDQFERAKEGKEGEEGGGGSVAGNKTWGETEAAARDR